MIQLSTKCRQLIINPTGDNRNQLCWVIMAWLKLQPAAKDNNSALELSKEASWFPADYRAVIEVKSLEKNVQSLWYHPRTWGL